MNKSKMLHLYSPNLFENATETSKVVLRFTDQDLSKWEAVTNPTPPSEEILMEWESWRRINFMDVFSIMTSLKCRQICIINGLDAVHDNYLPGKEGSTGIYSLKEIKERGERWFTIKFKLASTRRRRR